MLALVVHTIAGHNNSAHRVCNFALVFCRKPPQIKFKLDFGKALGSAYTAKAVRLWLDPFLRETLADLIVWPNRIVVPILPEEVTGPLDDLMLRSVLRQECYFAETSACMILHLGGDSSCGQLHVLTCSIARMMHVCQ